MLDYSRIYNRKLVDLVNEQIDIAKLNAMLELENYKGVTLC